MPAFYQPCWFCGRALRVDRDFEWTTIRVGWTGQKLDDIEVMVHVGCAPRAEAARKHYEELKAIVNKHIAGMMKAAAGFVCAAGLFSGCATQRPTLSKELPPLPPGSVVSKATPVLRRASVASAAVAAPAPPTATVTFNGRVAVSRFQAEAGSVTFWSSTNLIDWIVVGRFDRSSAGMVLLRDESATNRPATFYRISQ